MESPGWEMDRPHLFRAGLHLLMIMVKARLEGYPTGRFRKAAITSTASRVHELVCLIDLPVPGRIECGIGEGACHLFKERVKLLCVMATAMIGDEYPLGRHRRAAMLDNIDSMAALLFPGQGLSLDHNIDQNILTAA